MKTVITIFSQNFKAVIEFTKKSSFYKQLFNKFFVYRLVNAKTIIKLRIPARKWMPWQDDGRGSWQKLFSLKISDKV